MSIRIKTPEEVEKMRTCGRIWKKVRDFLEPLLVAGTVPMELDILVEQKIRSFGATPSFKGFHGFPASICASVNKQVVHAIPDKKPLQLGDLITIDMGIFYQNFHCDAAFSVVIGGDEAHPERARFSRITREAMMIGIDQIRPGRRIGDIGAAIETYVRKNGYNICKEYTGHGIGSQMHEDPHIFNHGPANIGPMIQEGMTFCIEPITSRGNGKCQILADGWTVITADGKEACQWESCGVVTADGFEIFNE